MPQNSLTAAPGANHRRPSLSHPFRLLVKQQELIGGPLRLRARGLLPFPTLGDSTSAAPKLSIGDGSAWCCSKV
jgi:hypothetical protein